MKTKVVIAAVVAVILAIAFVGAASASAPTAPKAPKVPFENMQMVFTVNANGAIVTRSVSFLTSTSTGFVVRDSTSNGADSILTVDSSREIVECSGNDPVVCQPHQLVEYWVPPEQLSLGATVSYGSFSARVTGDTLTMVMGKVLPAWVVTWTQTGTGVEMRDILLYDKSTGLWLGASWVMLGDTGSLLMSWSGQLTSTNVVLGK